MPLIHPKGRSALQRSFKTIRRLHSVTRGERRPMKLGARRKQRIMNPNQKVRAILESREFTEKEKELLIAELERIQHVRDPQRTQATDMIVRRFLERKQSRYNHK